MAFSMSAPLREARAAVLSAAREAGLDVEVIDALTTQAIQFSGSTAADRNEHRVDQVVERQWYASVSAGKPDYSVYDTPWYVAETIACWSIYSRKYLHLCEKAGLFRQLGPVARVLDLGCGVGITTSALAARFPDAQVWGTNIEGSTQWRVAAVLAKSNRFQLTEMIPEMPMDLVFASEFFEHIEAPVTYLSDVLARTHPRMLVVANTFSAPAIGHFPLYRDPHGTQVNGRRIARLFSKTMREAGYRRAEVNFWNNRPHVWVRG